MFLKFFNNNRSNILLLIALLVYNSLFFSERFGLNILLFLLLVFSFQYLLFKESFKSRNVLISVALTVFTAVMLVWHNSLLSKWMFFISYAITLGFIIQPGLRFIGYSLLTSISNFVKFPVELLTWEKSSSKAAKRGLKFSKVWLVSIFPILIGVVFFMIYRISNPIFAEVTDTFWKEIGIKISELLKHISVLRMLFVLLGLFLLSGMLIHRNYSLFAHEEALLADSITRKRSKPWSAYFSIAFKNEYWSGLILLIIMNLMLLVLNTIDIKYLWINFEIPKGLSLSELVHQGTEWLIVSVFLSMIVVIYLFRANQNFYSKSKWLKILAIAWMLQNMVLTISLWIRNNNYISWHALAYKRLGVYVFIALTIFGLITMLIKIHHSKSLFYLLRMNAWAAYLVLCGVCIVNWDIYIAKYNVEFKSGAQLDTDFLLKLSPKAYPYIFENIDRVEQLIKAHELNVENIPYTYYNFQQFKYELTRLSQIYIAGNSETTWRSYSVADDCALQYLKDKIKE